MIDVDVECSVFRARSGHTVRATESLGRWPVQAKVTAKTSSACYASPVSGKSSASKGTAPPGILSPRRALLFFSTLEGIYLMTIKLKNQLGSLVGPVRTSDAVDSARFRDMAVAEVQLALDGLLDADDLRRIKSILAKYVGGGGTTTALGMTTPTGDEMRSKLRAEHEHNRQVARGYEDFWSKQNAALAASITR
jgi:hypothetical protein